MNLLNHYSIRQVIVGAMAMLALLVVGGFAAMLITASRAASELRQEFEQLVTDEHIAERIVAHTQNQLAAARRYSASGDPAQLDAFRAAGMAVYDEIRRYLFRDLDSEERRLVEGIRERHEAVEVAAQRQFSDSAAGTGIDQLPEADALTTALDSLLELRRESSFEMVARQEQIWRWLYLVGAVLVITFLLALYLAAVFLRRRLVEPLSTLADATRRVGSGDFDQSVAVAGNDELADVARSFNEMAERLLIARRETASSEERYHSLFDRIPVGLYRTTPDGMLVAGNRALLQLLGYASREQMLRANAADLYDDVTDRASWQALLENAEGVVEVDRQHTRADGSMIWVRDTASVVRDADGRIQYYEGALQDVTERVRAEEALRRSEARFRSLIENAHEGVLIIAADGVIRYQSPAVERMLGHPRKETVGHARFDLIHPEDLGALRELYGTMSDTDGGARSAGFRCRHQNGEWRVLEAVGTNLLADPAIGGFVVNITDVTVRHQLEQQLQHAQKLEAVGRLAGGIAHDFNNLLTAIQGYTDLLGDSAGTDAATRSDLLEIRRAVERAARLTRQLLAFSRRQVVRRQPTEVGAVVGELDQMLRRLITEDVHLRTRLTPDCWVSIDPGQLEQVVVNLVVNARDARPETGIAINVHPVSIDAADAFDTPGLPSGEYVLITVEDDGHGIDAAVMPFIFDPFFTTKAVGSGTGLGLATVYGIVEESGGGVYARNRREGGTAMRVFLPRVPRPAQQAPVQRRLENDHQGTETVLLVEDEAAVRTLAERVLRRHGYTVYSAANGVDALERVRAEQLDVELLVTDVVMPAMGGVQLAMRLLDERPSLQVLFISGYAADTVPGTAADGRPMHFLEKPFSPDALAHAVRSILDTRTARI